MTNVMKAVQVLDFDKALEDFPLGGWQWLHEKQGIVFKLPNGEVGAIMAASVNGPKWTITGDGETINATPSIWWKQGKGVAAGEWHGFLTNGEWRS